jgi:hypothetical protein
VNLAPSNWGWLPLGKKIPSLGSQNGKFGGDNESTNPRHDFFSGCGLLLMKMFGSMVVRLL